jgi:undecaprenyl-diphosphatase
MDSLMILGAQYLIFLGFFLAIGLGIWEKNKKEIFLQILIGIVLTFIATKLFNLLFFYPRPFIVYQLNPLINPPASSSFPSFHTAVMTSIALTFTLLKNKFSPLFWFLAAWVGLARIYVGVHYPLDILGGVIVGLISALVASFILRRLISTAL